MSINNEDEFTLNCALRLIFPSLELAEKFKTQCPQYDVSSRRFFKDRTKYVVTLELESNINLEPLKIYLDGSEDYTTGELEKYTYNSEDQLVNYQRLTDAEATTPTVDYSYGPLGRRWNKQNLY